MTAIERIKQYLDYKGISKYKFYKDTGVSNGYLDRKGSMGSEIIENIFYHYADLNLVWLLTGEGEMLLENEQISKASVNSDEWKEKAVLWMKIASERLEMIETQREVIQMLKDEIKKLKSTQQDEQSRTA